MSATDFHIDVTWPRLPAAGARDVAHIGMRVGDSVLTQLVEIEAGVVRNHLRTSAIGLALWFVDNWWRLRWESLHDQRSPVVDWRLRHELTSARGGTNWPPLMIYGTGEQVVIAPSFGSNIAAGPVRWIELGAVHTLSGEMYEAAIDKFLGTVAATCITARDGAAFDAQLRQLEIERGDPAMAAWRRLEARLGYDPDQAPDQLIESLSSLESQLGEAAIDEAAMAAPGAGSFEALNQAVEASRASELAADLSITERIDATLHDRRASPWRLAERAAAILRFRIDAPQGPLADDKIADMLKVGWDRLQAAPATAARLPYGARLRERQARQKLALQRTGRLDRRFELARIIGDSIWNSSDNFGVISRSRSDRQKFQRAFAQSLLCPFEDLRHQIDLNDPTESQVAKAARRFQVQPGVVHTLLVNKGVLPRETLAERLEAA